MMIYEGHPAFVDHHDKSYFSLIIRCMASAGRSDWSIACSVEKVMYGTFFEQGGTHS